MAKAKTAAEKAAAAKALESAMEHRVVVQPPRFRVAEFWIRGTHPYVQNRFGGPGREAMRAKQLAGSQAGKGRKRDPKNPQALFEGCQHVSREGWVGIPSPAIRCAMIDACRVVGFKMTLAKLSVFCEADGFGLDGTPLFRITKGKPEMLESAVRNDSGVADLRYRPMWSPGWEAKPRIRWDEDQFSASDVVNLLARAGQQVGIGEGRPFSRMSAGQDWGLFEVVSSR